MGNKKLGMNKPLSKSEREIFLNEAPDVQSAKLIDSTEEAKQKKIKAEKAIRKTITMYPSDIEKIELLMQRCINLGVKDKGISGTLKMALYALDCQSDEQFLACYKQVK